MAGLLCLDSRNRLPLTERGESLLRLTLFSVLALLIGTTVLAWLGLQSALRATGLPARTAVGACLAFATRLTAPARSARLAAACAR